MSPRRENREGAREARTAPARATALAHGMAITIRHGDTAARREPLTPAWHRRAAYLEEIAR